MKKLTILTAIIAMSFSINAAKAQIGVHLNINLGPRAVYAPAPPPAPVMDDEYYYLPDAEAYYSVPEQVYYYQNEGRWMSGAHLPGRFYDADYNHMRHFAINEPRPYLRNDYYRARFNGPRDGGRDFDNQRFNGPRDGRNYNAYNNYSDRRDQNQHDNRDFSRGGRANRY